MKTTTLKVTSKNISEENCMKEFFSIRANPKLFFINEEGYLVNRIEVKLTRTFSVGYSREEIKRLEEKYAVYVTYNIYYDGEENIKAITKNQNGSFSTIGACDGYYADWVKINGTFSGGGFGEADDGREIADLVTDLYKQQ